MEDFQNSTIIKLLTNSNLRLNYYLVMIGSMVKYEKLGFEDGLKVCQLR
jgi:hypothetical protein